MKLESRLLRSVLALSALLTTIAIPRRSAAQPGDLFISEYVEGSSNNKAIEIYNGTGAPVDLGMLDYTIEMYFNGGTTSNLTHHLTGIVPDGGVFVLSNPLATLPGITGHSNQTTASSAWYNGNDAVQLRKLGGTVLLDTIGQIGNNPGTEWGSGLTSTADNTLRRKSGVCASDTIASDPFDPSVEWTGFAQDDVADLGQHSATCVAGDGGVDADAGNDGGSQVGACGDPATPIGAVQGAGTASPLAGQTLEIEAVVVASFQNDPINGFFVQQSDGNQDGNPNTSDGLFVFEGSSVVAVAQGNVVRVRGRVTEFNGLTEITDVTSVAVCSGPGLASAQTVTFPVAAVDDLERYEGMLVTIAQPLTVTGNFGVGRFGSLDLSVGGRLFQPTQVVDPGAPAVALQSSNDRSHIILDDLSNGQDPAQIPYLDPDPPVGGRIAATRRLGDTLPSLTGILDGSFPSDGAYRIRPVSQVSFTSVNPRPTTPPPVGGRLRVASANVLNYFVTLDSPAGALRCGPTCNLACRGANTADERTRQRTKLLRQMQGLDADVACLTELENPGCAQGTLPEAMEDLLIGLNASPFYPAGTYDSVHVPATIGTDAIKVGLLFKTAKVRPVCTTAVLTSAFDPRFIDSRNRPALTQTFEEIATGQRFTIICNHLKSKGSDCLPDDPDLADGQGNCNLTRTRAAQALVSWAASAPTGCAEQRVLIAGDLNSYAKENPITTLVGGGFQLLGAEGTSGYSFQFQSQSGSLDYLLGSAAIASQITGTARWHNNADEPVILDYNTEFKTEDLFDPTTPFRVADHDPTLVGLSLNAPLAAPAMGGPGTMATLSLGLLAAGCALLLRDRRRRAA